MKVIVFMPWYNKKLQKPMRAFASGIPNCEIRDVRQYEDCDIAVIFGLVKKTYSATHTKEVILKKHSGRSLIVMESAFYNRKKYFAIGFSGIHGSADFRSEGASLDRWESMNAPVQPWSNRPKGPMVVCGQLPRDTNVQHTDHVDWCKKTVGYYLKNKIPVLFRPHPRCDDPEIYGVNEKLWDRRKLKHTLKEARGVVIWNSTSGVDAVIAGVPVIAQSHDALSFPVASSTLNPDYLIRPDRDKLFAKIGYAQWTLAEMKEGLPWLHLTRS